ncbi:MAG: hypothetical protein COW42_13570 [Deltaproteobacteria bacterium CG17_big_fil_post_rev_8_21_14_2_50_63_7]|nr:MAG: hypothetical protein COW42_13570 [Deltaproteobacteria bacterium CG17_big_fil_post_rev_8_21_14_2_50_63_7]
MLLENPVTCRCPCPLLRPTRGKRKKNSTETTNSDKQMLLTSRTCGQVTRSAEPLPRSASRGGPRRQCVRLRPAAVQEKNVKKSTAKSGPTSSTLATATNISANA